MQASGGCHCGAIRYLISGDPVCHYASSAAAQQHFCGACGTSLFYTNETIFPGMIDVQSATLDDPGALPLQLEVQTAERISWMPAAPVPQFERYPAAP